ncbi:MAG: hypothetical protein ACHQF0_17780 [Chitinophagales bacterium]
MKPNRFIQKSFAIILLLVFAQKSGIELYLHNYLHTTHYKQSIPNTSGKNVVSYPCNCIDDFSMPFADNAEPVIQTIFPKEIEFVVFHKSSALFSSIFFYSLRGPPVSIA